MDPEEALRLLEERGVLARLPNGFIRWTFMLVEKFLPLIGLVLKSTEADWDAETLIPSRRKVTYTNPDGTPSRSAVHTLASGHGSGMLNGETDRKRMAYLKRLSHTLGQSLIDAGLGAEGVFQITLDGQLVRIRAWKDVGDTELGRVTMRGTGRLPFNPNEADAIVIAFCTEMDPEVPASYTKYTVVPTRAISQHDLVRSMFSLSEHPHLPQLSYDDKDGISSALLESARLPLCSKEWIAELKAMAKEDDERRAQKRERRLMRRQTI